MERPPVSGSPEGMGYPRVLPPLVGRRQEWQVCMDTLQAVLAGRPQVVMVSGDAGIGKTRLVKDMCLAATQRGLRVYYGRCYEHFTVPYLPFVESLLRPLTHHMEATRGVDVDALRHFLHGAAPTVGEASPALRLQSEQGQLRMLFTVVQATILFAQQRPTMVVVDDLQWADTPSLDLLEHLVYAVADAAVREPIPLLIVGLYRPEDTAQRLTALTPRFQREAICAGLELRGLEEAELPRLLEGIGIQRPSQQLLATLKTVTRGNPLFIQEMILYLQQSGALQQRGNYMVTTTAAEELKLPQHLLGAMTARLQALSAPCLRLLTLGALLGDDFTPQLLSAVSDMDEEQVSELLEEALRQRVLVEERQGWQFAHPLLQHVMHNQLSTRRRQQIHHRIATVLQRLYTDSGDPHVLQIAHHLLCAGPEADAAEVVRYAMQAGAQSFTRCAWAEAARYYGAALATTESTRMLTDASRAALHARAGLAYYRDHDVGPCLYHFDQALAAYGQTNDLHGLARVLIDKTRAQLTIAAIPFGTLANLQPLEEVLEALGENAPGLRGSIMAIMAEAYWHGKQQEQAKAMARRALEIGQDSMDDHLCAHASFALGLAHSQSLNAHQALTYYQGSLAAARRANDLWLQSWPLDRLLLIFTRLGRLAEAEQLIQEARELYAQTHNWGDYSIALAAMTAILVTRGDFQGAARYAQETLLMLSRSHYPWGGVLGLPALACGHALQGAWAAAEDALALLIEPGRVFHHPGSSLLADAWMYRQLLRAHAGAGDEVQQAISAEPQRLRIEEPVDVGSLARVCALVEISDLIATPALAYAPYQVLSRAADQGIVFSSRWVFLLPRILGLAAALQHWWDEAEAHFQHAIEVASTIGARPELGRAYLDYASMLVGRGRVRDHQRAHELLGRARLIFEKLHMRPFLQRAEQLNTRLLTHFSPALQAPETFSIIHDTQEAVGFLRMAQKYTVFLE